MVHKYLAFLVPKKIKYKVPTCFFENTLTIVLIIVLKAASKFWSGFPLLS